MVRGVLFFKVDKPSKLVAMGKVLGGVVKCEKMASCGGRRKLFGGATDENKKNKWLLN